LVCADKALYISNNAGRMSSFFMSVDYGLWGKCNKTITIYSGGEQEFYIPCYFSDNHADYPDVNLIN
jgi:hypothetical protein